MGPHAEFALGTKSCRLIGGCRSAIGLWWPGDLSRVFPSLWDQLQLPVTLIRRSWMDEVSEVCSASCPFSVQNNSPDKSRAERTTCDWTCDVWQSMFWRRRPWSACVMCLFLDCTISSRGSSCHGARKARATERGGVTMVNRGWLAALMIRAKAARCLFFRQLHIGGESSCDFFLA